MKQNEIFILITLIIFFVVTLVIIIVWSITVRKIINTPGPPQFALSGLGSRCIQDNEIPITEGDPLNFVPQKCEQN